MSDNKKLTKGSIGEYHAIFKLLEKGYNVYKNAECNGQIDIILESRETKKLLRIDIKTAKAKLRKNQLNYPDDGILRLVIDNDGIKCLNFKDIEQFKGHKNQSRAQNT